MEYSAAFDFEIKSISETGTFVGKGSVYGTVDLGSDIMEPGSLSKSVQERGNAVPILWQHDPKVPIGLAHLTDTPSALLVNGRLSLGVPEAKNALSLMKDKVVRGLSIGYQVVKADAKNGIRRIKEARLFEISIVTFPMNEGATIDSVKRFGSPSELTEMVSSFQRKLDAITGPRLSPEHQSMVDDFSRRLDRAVRS
jgi:uncharacterized protein